MVQRKMPLATYPVFLAFLCMGFGDVVGPLTGLLKEEYSLTNFMAQWIPFMGFIMSGALSIPIGIIQDRTGKRNILIIGLGLAFLGLSLPVLASFSSFGLLLVSNLMLGAGAALMQVSGNPFMRDVSAKGKDSRNLSLAQFVKAIGIPSQGRGGTKNDKINGERGSPVCRLRGVVVTAFERYEKDRLYYTP